MRKSMRLHVLCSEIRHPNSFLKEFSALNLYALEYIRIFIYFIGIFREKGDNPMSFKH